MAAKRGVKNQAHEQTSIDYVTEFTGISRFVNRFTFGCVNLCHTVLSRKENTENIGKLIAKLLNPSEKFDLAVPRFGSFFARSDRHNRW